MREFWAKIDEAVTCCIGPVLYLAFFKHACIYDLQTVFLFVCFLWYLVVNSACKCFLFGCLVIIKFLLW